MWHLREVIDQPLLRTHCGDICSLLEIIVDEMDASEAEVERVFSRFKMVHTSVKSQQSAEMTVAMTTVNFWETQQNEIQNRLPGSAANPIRLGGGDSATAAAVAVPRVNDNNNNNIISDTNDHCNVKKADDLQDENDPDVPKKEWSEHIAMLLHSVWEKFFTEQLEIVKKNAAAGARPSSARCALCRKTRAEHAASFEDEGEAEADIIPCSRCHVNYFFASCANVATARSSYRSGALTWSCNDCENRVNVGFFPK
jgi:hypothetical protein